MVGDVRDVECGNVVDEAVVVDVDEKPECKSNGDDPFCAPLDFPEVVGDASAADDGPIGVMAAATADCLDEVVGVQEGVDPDARATSGEDVAE